MSAPVTRPQRALELTCCVLSVATMAYTGVFLAGQPAVPFWNTPALVCVFVFSSLSCGVSLMLLVDYFTQDQTLLLRAAKPLQKCHLACLAAEAKINYNTVTKAYRDLELAGLIVLVRGRGMFVQKSDDERNDQIEAADALLDATKIYREDEMAFELRSMHLLSEGMKESGSSLVIPSAYSEGFKRSDGKKAAGESSSATETAAQPRMTPSNMR